MGDILPTTVTIILPTRNEEEAIEPTIDSIPTGWCKKLEIDDEEMVKNKQKKVIIMQARNFSPEDLNKIKAKINDALMEYSIEIMLMDQDIKLETANEFFARIEKF